MAGGVKIWEAREWKRQAVRDGNRDGAWVELGVGTQGYNIGQVGMVRKLSGGVRKLSGGIKMR